ncbi:hypothetical protein, partial [Selenomonas felix]|uniref:hypothetical protein n=1 Tax=Selenomonas felix TaxID=1944634 RepID=UPI0023549412
LSSFQPRDYRVVFFIQKSSYRILEAEANMCAAPFGGMEDIKRGCCTKQTCSSLNFVQNQEGWIPFV